MSRLGLTNIYLKCGLVLIVVGLVCGGALFAVRPRADSTAFELLMWGAQGGFLSGVVLYVIGRIVHVVRQARRV
ncbi:hypothetical protein [Luteimonas sp. 3794]|uniref:hypothetical protein n=1 Tax=Luteimonas sp. 3794 TaxID=2817730 RepID=UPI00285AB21F|nr:hypothetical protein [Luteimonas sp. 3794]MDR6992383.1 hypothetical protein [Luteimonas sp. 3794]